MKEQTRKSRIKFTIIAAVLIIISICSLNLLLGTTSEANGYTENNYKTIEICSGDTLWDIAALYMPDDMDIRDAVYELQEINDLDTTALTPGQELLVPEN